MSPFNIKSCGPVFLGGMRHAEPGPSALKEFVMSAQPRRRRLEVEEIGDVTVVNFIDRKILDDQNIQIIGEQLFGLVATESRLKILTNFSNVDNLSTAPLAKIITLNMQLQTPSVQTT